MFFGLVPALFLLLLICTSAALVIGLFLSLPLLGFISSIAVFFVLSFKFRQLSRVDLHFDGVLRAGYSFYGFSRRHSVRVLQAGGY